MFQYPNKNRASTIRYHDHTLGMTRLNVYAGPAGFTSFAAGRQVTPRCWTAAPHRLRVSPGPSAQGNDEFTARQRCTRDPDRDTGPLLQRRRFVVLSRHARVLRRQHRSVQAGHRSLADLEPEFFGNMIKVNGNTWPFQTVEQRRYRFRVLNGCNSRFLILDFSLLIPGVDVWQIGNQGGFLAAPASITGRRQPAADGPGRARGRHRRLHERCQSGITCSVTWGRSSRSVAAYLGVDFPVADPAATGQIMQFRVVPAVAPDPSTPAQFLVLPPITPLPPATTTRRLALLEELSRSP